MMGVRFKSGLRLLLLLAQTLIALAELSPFGKKCSDICGITTDVPGRNPATKFRLFKRSAEESEEDEPIDMSEYEDESVKDGSDETAINEADTRIVNGYKTNSRPWLVLMLPQGGVCGGVLVNNLFVLSAAHCYCRMDGTAISCSVGMVNGVPTSVPDYDVSELVRIYVGVNGKPMSAAKEDPSLTYKPVKVWIREGWVLGQGFSPDISMAKLHTPVDFKPNVVAPICMPTEEKTQKALKENIPVFVAGWGAQFSTCDTNDSGPSPNTMCKFPFEHNGQIHNFCTHEPTPAESDPVCKDFFKFAKKNNLEIKTHDGAGVLLPVKVENGKGKHKFCFETGTPVPGNEMGWCGTCYHGVSNPGQEGQEGYCDPFNPLRTPHKSETSQPKTGKNWGMCASWCRPNAQQSAAQELMETGLELLDLKICNALGSDLVFNEELEICAGNKKLFPGVDVFKQVDCSSRHHHKHQRYTRSAKGGSCYVKQENTDEVYNYGIDSPFDFYLGGSDSCQGDSGGPLVAFMTHKNSVRGFTLGAVSRGTGCANLNAPGIFSKVSHHMEWIKKIADEGTC